MRSVKSNIYSLDEILQQQTEGGDDVDVLMHIEKFVSDMLGTDRSLIRYVTVQKYEDTEELFSLNIQFKQNPENAQEE